MKKLISLLAVIALVTVLATVAFAAEEPALQIKDVVAAPGDEVVMNIEIVNNPGMTLGEFVFEFDEALEFVSAAAVGGEGWDWLPMVNDKVDNSKFGSVVFSASNEPLTGDAVLVTLTLKVKEGTVPGKYAVNAVVDFIGDDDADFITGTTFTGYVVIECTEHVWEVVSETPATCTEAGKVDYKCAYCDATKTETVDALDHTWGDWEVTTPATCAGAGVETRTCSVCGETETREIPAAEGHTWNEGEVTTEATCCTDGVKTFTCTVCGETKTETIAATGEHELAYVDNEDGLTHKIVCSNSGKELGNEDHIYGELVDDPENEGWKYAVCEKCGYTHREGATPPPTGDNTMIAVAMATVSMMGIALVVSKKKEF